MPEFDETPCRVCSTAHRTETRYRHQRPTRRILFCKSEMIQPYPTQAEVLKRIGDSYMCERLTPGLKKLFSKWFAWRRR
jgi:hypothetical protein